MVFNEVNGINSHFEDDLKWSGVIIFNFNELDVWESFLDIFFSGVEITLDEIQCDMFNILIEIFDLLNEFVSTRNWELFFLLLLVGLHDFSFVDNYNKGYLYLIELVDKS